MSTSASGLSTEIRILSSDAQTLGREAPGGVSLVVTSPPYPMIEMWDASFSSQQSSIAGYLASGEGDSAFEAMHQILDGVWREVAELLLPGGIACINIGDALRTMNGVFRMYPNAARISRTFSMLGFHALPGIIWRKSTNAPNKFMGSGMLPGGAYMTLEHEHILIFRKGSRRIFSRNDGPLRRRSAYFWEERNLWFSDMWDLAGSRQRMAESKVRDRSGAFPLELAYRLINMYSLQGELVADPFLGTGTTAFAAAAAGRSFVGTELEADIAEQIPGEILSRFNPENDKNEGSSINRRRLDAHDGFINAYRERGKHPGYLNRVYGFPVITAQEQDLALPEISALEQDGMTVRLNYSFSGV